MVVRGRYLAQAHLAVTCLALLALQTGGVRAASSDANDLSRDMHALRSVEYASYDVKPISDAAVGIASASDDRLSIVYRTYDLSGKRLSSASVSVKERPANQAYSNAGFLAGKDGRVYLFWLSDDRLCGAIIDSTGKVISAPAQILEERLGGFEAAAIQEARGTMLVVANRYMSPGGSGAACTKMIYLNMKHEVVGSADYWHRYIDSTRSIVLDENLGVHVVELDQLRPKHGEVAVVYRYFGDRRTDDAEQDIAIGDWTDIKDVRLTLDAKGVAHIYYIHSAKPADKAKKPAWEVKSVDVKAYGGGKAQRGPICICGSLVKGSGITVDVADGALLPVWMSR